jgi:hypothetical protein
MTENSAVSWTTVVARRGASKKVPLTPGRRTVDNSAVPLVGEVIFEDDDLKSELLVHKAAALVEQALCSSSVLFSFPGKLFGDRTDAYNKVIEEQVGANVDFRHISSTVGEKTVHVFCIFTYSYRPLGPKWMYGYEKVVIRMLK